MSLQNSRICSLTDGRGQRGIALGSFLVTCVIVIFVALIGLKLAGPYMEYFKIKADFKKVASDPSLQTASAKEIKSGFWKFAAVDDITSITQDDIEVEKTGSDITLSAEYSVKVPLVANVSLLVDFNPTSN